MKLFDFEATGVWLPEVEALGGDGARGGCRSVLFKDSAGILRLMVGGWT